MNEFNSKVVKKQNFILDGDHFSKFCLEGLGVNAQFVQKEISKWLEEDFGHGDSLLSSLKTQFSSQDFVIVAKSDFVISGLPIVAEVFRQAYPTGSHKLSSSFHDGDLISKGDIILSGSAHPHAILLSERVALNIASHLSGIASSVHKAKEVLKAWNSHSKLSLVETRKTTPGLRIFEKYAVRCAGCRNHRHGLDSGAMLKENHLRVFQGLKTIKVLKEELPLLTALEVEVTSLSEFQEALEFSPDIIMLDNFSIEDIKEAIKYKKEKQSPTKIEVSGNITLDNLKDFAKLELDFLSSGALIHKSEWADMSLQISR